VHKATIVTAEKAIPLPYNHTGRRQDKRKGFEQSLKQNSPVKNLNGWYFYGNFI
jgi:hypothetical protein